jgi:hypothetical protein
VSHSREQIVLSPLQLPIPWMRQYRRKPNNLFYFWIPPSHPPRIAGLQCIAAFA